ncbi:hypothetical protein KEM60_01489 [Austwickia sp. TVS 96-490-7B]|uniref:PadR family transcriptional regulator n=1 Tax=Austwickia sp. TVS 96-490-7B TaxID=2830843 RepID=UPI001C58790B|nr:PadR family transcriptional regulator [Austwickia sp. TVS 96-490-7B]MBW3085292.1 hypothetical protein [Austwickia sp. TVS 96-490-7B]
MNRHDDDWYPADHDDRPSAPRHPRYDHDPRSSHGPRDPHHRPPRPGHEHAGRTDPPRPDALFGPDGPLGLFGPDGPFGAANPFVAFADVLTGRHADHRPGPYRAYRSGPRAAHRGNRARRGDVRLAILGLLAEGDKNGYQIIRALEERTDGRWRPSPGAIYPALNQLEDEGLIAPAQGKVFTLTDEGRTHVDDLGDRARPWESHADDSARTSQDPLNGTGELWMAYGQLGLAARVVAQSSDADVTRAAVELLEESRRSLYRLLAEERDEHSRAETDSDDPQDGEHRDPLV